MYCDTAAVTTMALMQGLFLSANPSDYYALNSVKELFLRQDRTARKLTKEVLFGLYGDGLINYEPTVVNYEQEPKPHEPVYLAHYIARVMAATTDWREGRHEKVLKLVKEVRIVDAFHLVTTVFSL